MTRCLTDSPEAWLVTVSINSSSKKTLTVLHGASNVESRSVIAIPGGPDDGVERSADTTSNERFAWAEGPPLLLTVCPVKVWDVDVPSAPTAVTDAAYVPGLAYTCDVVDV